MAQWSGQFSGRNHGTAIVDAQAQLELAVEAFRADPEYDRVKRAKNVVRLAKRLLTARRRPLRTSVQADETIGGSSAGRNSAGGSSVGGSSATRVAELERLEAGGIEAILEEFHCLDALTVVAQTKK